MTRSRQARKAMRKTQDPICIHGISIGIPRELSIHANAVDEGIAKITQEVCAFAAEKQDKHERPHHRSTRDVDSATERAFVSIATSAWRAKVKMVDTDTGETKPEMQRVHRHIESICESLTSIGIETIDPAGRAYDSGMALKVISFEQTPGLSKEEIKETIKPSVIWQGRLIQMGEVIVATPQNISDSERKTDEQNNH